MILSKMFIGLLIIDFYCILGEIEQGILTREVSFERCRNLEPCDFCSPQDCVCTYEQYKARMEKEVIVVIWFL